MTLSVRWLQFVLIVLLSGVLTVTNWEPASSTPNRSLSDGLPVRPDPSECQVAARTPDEFAVLVDIAHGLAGTPVTPNDAATVLASTPTVDEAEASPTRTILIKPGRVDFVDDATVAAVVGTMREWAACLNAGDAGRAFGLMSDEYVIALISAGVLTPDDIMVITSPAMPEPEVNWVTLFRVDGIYATFGGGVAASVVQLAGEASGDPEPGIFFVDFRFQRGRYQIDNLRDISKLG